MLKDLWNAWQAGQELSDPAKWKNRQLTGNAIGVVLLGLIQLIKVKYPDFDVAPEVLDLISAGISAFLAAGNVYLTKATTTKI